MRFETSQTTPPHLNRRLQLRMLSFVGMMAIIMFTLSVLNNRPRASEKSGGVSPDSLSFEVRRESLELKDDEFIAALSEEISLVSEEEIRGQSPRSRGESDTSDRTPFAPRSKEQKKSSPTNGIDRVPAGDPLDLDFAQDLRSRPSSGRPLTEFDQIPASAAPPAIDDWASEPGFSPSESDVPDSGSFIRPIPRHRKPVRQDDSDENLRTPHVMTETAPPKRDKRGSDVIVDEAEEWTSNPRSRQIEPARGLSTRDTVYESDERPAPPIDMGRRSMVTPFPPRQPEPIDVEIAKARIDKRYLDTVKDNTVGVRRDESEAFYWLLDHARRVPPARLQRVAQNDIQYINLMTEPDRFRGEPITIEGDLWRLYELDASRNAYGVSKIYEGWVFTGDSSNHPFRVVCTSLPSGIEPGDNLRKPVRVTGYFFKKEGYQSNGGVHIAPTLLARRININAMPNGIPLTVGILPYMIGAIMAIGLALLVTIVGFAISDGRSSREGMDRLRRQPQMSFAGLQIPETISVEESLRQLAAVERGSTVTGAYGPLLSEQTIRNHAVHDYSTSRQLQAETGRLQRSQQTGALQNWSARQQAAQAEIDALLDKGVETKQKPIIPADNLAVDQFDPARNILEHHLNSSERSVNEVDNDTVSFTLAPTMDRTRLKHETEAMWPGTTLASEVSESDHPPAAPESDDSSQERDLSEEKGRRNRRNWRRGKSA